MPKKTKKQKLIAEYRRKLQSIPQPIVSTPQAPTSSTSSTYTLQNHKSLHKHELSFTSTCSLDQQTELQAVRKDLNWTLILVAGMLILEIGLWKILGT